MSSFDDKKLQWLIPKIASITGFLALNSCSFNFELTSQKTALENQIMGSYKELDDEVLLMASVRGVGTNGEKKDPKIQSDAAKTALNAKQNQSFNRDDVDDLKERQLVGEAKNGEIALLPKGIGLLSNASDDDLRFAKYLISEENKDREVITKRIIATSPSLSEKNLLEAKKIYRKSLLEESPSGTWIETESGNWERKSPRISDAHSKERPPAAPETPKT
ncbi:MAG: DUF1318 domain-containing protein [Proteobacteria bacterium]|nr:DUF1318 domain-containing protein [Pseudomonadota bacterium]